ncbi:MAG: DoxX family protein, partial [Acidimicrobiia bacterium]|nr:DoxX family protein [Acidimicrobiia bacterium]
MELIGTMAQLGAGLWILNVWLLRFNKETEYRGGSATNMREEFDEYGLPAWFM